jgi:probable rRNA maturation factor
MPSISFHCDDVSFHWNNEPSLSAWLTSVCENENAELTDLSYVFCSDEKLLEINRQFLNHDYYTDVITFDLSDIDESIEGEIYISLDRIKDHAENLAISFEQELCRVMAHGLLHLIGYDDRTPESKTEMTEREDISLSLLPEVPRGTFETQK